MRPIAIAWCALLAGVALMLLIFRETLVPNVGGQEYYRQPGFFPLITLVLVAAIGALLALRYATGSPIHEDEELVGTTPHFATIGAVVVLFAAYIEVVKWVGYPVTTVAFAVVAILATRAASFVSTIALVVISVTLYFAFVVYLDVWFPEPWINEFLGAS